MEAQVLSVLSEIHQVLDSMNKRLCALERKVSTCEYEDVSEIEEIKKSIVYLKDSINSGGGF